MFVCCNWASVCDSSAAVAGDLERDQPPREIALAREVDPAERAATKLLEQAKSEVRRPRLGSDSAASSQFETGWSARHIGRPGDRMDRHATGTPFLGPQERAAAVSWWRRRHRMRLR